MDDILHAPRDEDAQQAGLPLAKRLERYRAAWMDGMARVRLGARRFQHKLDEATAGGKRLFTPLNFLAVAAVVGVATVVATVYTPSYVVSVDGVPLGTVSDPQVFEDVMDRVEARAATILGYDYEIPSTVSYTFALSERGKLSDTGEFETYLFDQIGAVMKSYVLKVDGTFIGAAADRESLDALLDAIKAPYRTENTVSADFTSNVVVSHEYTPSDVNQDLDAMLARLTQNTNGQTTYEVQSGDTFMQIALDNGMTVSEMQQLNPEIDINRIYIGQLLNVREEIPYLSVQTVDSVTYTEAVECPVEQVEDDSMYQGESRVIDPGVPGQALVSANITYVNGREQERDVQEDVAQRVPEHVPELGRGQDVLEVLEPDEVLCKKARRRQLVEPVPVRQAYERRYDERQKRKYYKPYEARQQKGRGREQPVAAQGAALFPRFHLMAAPPQCPS